MTSDVHAVDRTPHDQLLVEVVLRPDLATNLLARARVLLTTMPPDVDVDRAITWDVDRTRWLDDFGKLTDHG